MVISIAKIGNEAALRCSVLYVPAPTVVKMGVGSPCRARGMPRNPGFGRAGGRSRKEPVMIRLVSLLAVGLALLPAPAIAQEPPFVGIGARVRVRTSPADEPVIGKVVGLDATTLTLSIKGLESPTIIARTAITEIEVSRRRSRGRSALIGAVTCAGLGAVLGFGVTDRRSFLFNNQSENMIVFGLAGGALGGLIGLAAGPGEDQWTATSLGPTSSSGLTPAPGLSASFTFRF